MNAVDRFSNAMARYNQQTVRQPAVMSAPQPVAQPAPRNDMERALNTVAEVTPILSRLAVMVNRVQNPTPSVQPYAGYPATPPIAQQPGPLGQSLQRLGQAVGGRDVDTFVRSAAPVIDEAIPLVQDIVNLVNGKKSQPAAPTYPQPYQAYPGYPQQYPVYTQGGTTYPTAQPSIAQQVAPIVDGVSSLVNLIGGLFKR